MADNYNKGDEIFLFGFSRGAFIVRSLAGLISQQGLRKRDREKFKDEFLQLQKQADPLLNDRQSEASKLSESGDMVQIKAIGVWDTVGEYVLFLVHGLCSFLPLPLLSALTRPSFLLLKLHTTVC